MFWKCEYCESWATTSHFHSVECKNCGALLKERKPLHFHDEDFFLPVRPKIQNNPISIQEA